MLKAMRIGGDSCLVCGWDSPAMCPRYVGQVSERNGPTVAAGKPARALDVTLPAG